MGYQTYFEYNGQQISTDNVGKILKKEMAEYLSRNKGLTDKVMSPLEKATVDYLSELMTDAAHTDNLRQYWEMLSSDEGFPLEFLNKDNLPLGSPNFGTFLQRGLFGLDKLYPGIPENTPLPDIGILDDQGNILADSKGIEIKSRVAEAYGRFKIEIASITASGAELKTPLSSGELKELEGILKSKKLEQKVALLKMLYKMQNFLFIRFLKEKEAGKQPKLHIKAMILFMRLILKKLIEYIKETSTDKPRIYVENKNVVEDSSRGYTYKRQFTVNLELTRRGEARLTPTGMLKQELRVLRDLYAVEYDFVNKLEQENYRTARQFYDTIKNEVLRHFKFHRLRE